MQEIPLTHIKRLQIDNIMRVEAVTIEPGVDTPDEWCVVIGGNNGAGKSSTIDSIAFAFDKRLCPSQVVRNGDGVGRVKIALSDGITIERSFTPDGGSFVKVTGERNEKISSPATLLKTLFDKLTFDPMIFIHNTGKEQAEMLRQLVGDAFEEVDATFKEAYAARTGIKARAKEIEAQFTPELAALANEPDVPSADSREIAAQLEQAKANNAQWDQALATLATLAEQKANLQAALADVEEKQAKWQAHRDTLTHDPRIPDLQSQLDNSSALAARAVEQRKARDLEAQVAAERKAVEAAEAAVKSAEEAKRKLLAESQLPVTGLSFDEKGVLLNGVPFSQASAAQKLRAAVAIGAAKNPDLKVLLVKEGAWLDDANRVALCEEAKARGFQIWLERVGDGQEVHVVIEEGRVRP